MSKTCARCGVSKECSHFGTRKKAKDGYDPWCKKCKSEYQVDYRAKNPGIDQKYPRERSAYNRQYAQQNAGRIREQRRARVSASPERYRIALAQWKLDNPERVRQHTIQKARRMVDDITTHYVMTLIRSCAGLSKETVYKNPDLINSYREQIRCKRLLKSLKQQSNG